MRPRFTLRRKRAVHVIIATTMLAAPASAFALTGASATPASSHSDTIPIKLRLHPARVRFGHRITVLGAAPVTDAGRRVTLETAVPGARTWRRTASATIGRHGRFHLRLIPRVSAVVRVVEQPVAVGAPAAPVAATTATPAVVTAAAIPAVATSPLRHVTVAARFWLHHTPLAVLGGGRIHVAGKLLPAIGGRSVRLQRHTSRGWRTVARGRTGRRGGFRLDYPAGSADGQGLRVLFAGDARNARTVQGAGRVAVFTPSVASWYYDGGSTACGFHATLGVANRTLPCGTRVTFRYGGRTATAVVDDRGPFVGGRTWDLNQGTAAALGFAGVGTVWTAG